MKTPPAELLDVDGRDALIVLRDLHKRHGDTVALRGLTLTVPQGAIFALLGPNGCGKTTTIKLLLGMANQPMDPIPRRPSSCWRRW